MLILVVAEPKPIKGFLPQPPSKKLYPRRVNNPIGLVNTCLYIFAAIEKVGKDE